MRFIHFNINNISEFIGYGNRNFIQNGGCWYNYYCDMSDEDSEKRYTDTRDWFYDIQDNYTETCRTMYLNSPHRDEFFEG
jgi:hypothetical protein